MTCFFSYSLLQQFFKYLTYILSQKFVLSYKWFVIIFNVQKIVYFRLFSNKTFLFLSIEFARSIGLFAYYSDRKMKPEFGKHVYSDLILKTHYLHRINIKTKASINHKHQPSFSTAKEPPPPCKKIEHNFIDLNKIGDNFSKINI